MADADRLPPQNLEAERGVLGSILLDNDTLNEVIPILDAADFYRGTHQILYATIRDLYDRAMPVDSLTLIEELTTRGLLAAAGGDDELGRIMASVPHAANGVYYAQIVRQKAQARRLAEVLTESLREVYSNTLSSDDLQARAEARVLAVRDDGLAETLAHAAGDLHEAMARLDRRRAGEVAGLRTGLFGLDATLNGMLPGQLLILAARPSIGKTALAMVVAASVAIEQEETALFASLEMGRTELADRLLSQRGKVDGIKIRTGKVDAGDDHRLGQFAHSIDRAKRLWVDDAPMQDVSRIAATARRLRRKHGLGLVVVDYLQLLRAPADIPKRASEQERVSAISARLKGLARELGVPVLALSQLNRLAEQRSDKRPQLADLRSSGAIEQDADVVMLLHRPEFYDPNDQPGVAELNVAKNRSGTTGLVRLSYDKRFTLFDDYAPTEAY